MTDLNALLERVEGAGGPDRELDYEIVRALCPAKFGEPPLTADREYYVPITASIDAALALVEKVLPGWDYSLDKDGLEYSFTLYSEPRDAVLGVHAQACLAILAALLRALSESSAGRLALANPSSSDKPGETS